MILITSTDVFQATTSPARNVDIHQKQRVMEKLKKQTSLGVMYDPDFPIRQNFYLTIIYVYLKLCSYEMKLQC